jgi:hypothetical protein
MKEGIGVFLWKCSVALYLLANGVLGLNVNASGFARFGNKGDFYIIFDRMFDGNIVKTLTIVCSIIAIVAAVAIILEMLNVQLSFLDTLLLIIAIIWAAYVIINIVSFITKGGNNKEWWDFLQRLGVHLMVLSSLLIASKKFG